MEWNKLSHISAVNSNKSSSRRPTLLSFLLIFCLLFSGAVSAVPTGTLKTPFDGHSFGGNVFIAIEASDPDGLSELRVVNPANGSSITFCNNCGTEYSSYRTRIPPDSMGLVDGSNTFHLEVVNNGLTTVIDSATFSWFGTAVSQVAATRTPGQIAVSWDPLPGYFRYNLYLASAQNITPQNISSLENNTAFRALRGTSQTVNIANDELVMYALVTAINSGGESAFSQILQIEALNNESPIAVADAFATNEDTPFNGNVLINDSDPEQTQLIASVQAPPVNGTLSLNENGEFTYSPQANFNGVDTFEYIATDADGGMTSGLVTITVTAVNDAPVGTADQYGTAEDTSLTVNASQGLLSNDSDVENGPLTILDPASVTAQNGVLNVLSDGSFNYTPNLNFNGIEAISYRVTDQELTSDITEFTINVSPVNDAPVAISDVLELATDETVLFAPLTNDSDIDGDTLRIVAAFAASGQVTITETTITYTAPATPGSDTIRYTIADSSEAQASADIVVTINQASFPPPTAVSDSFTTDEDTLLTVPGETLLANDLSPSGAPLTASTISLPQSGTLSFNADGSFTYQPALNFNGQDSFTYQVNDGVNSSEMAEVFITVSPINDLPVAVNDTLVIDENETVVFSPLVNDSDIDDEILRIVAASAASGQVTFTDTSISYTAPATPGADTIRYTIADASNGQASADVDVTINQVIFPPPTATSDSFTTDEDTLLEVPGETLLANDLSPSGAPLTASTISLPQSGTLSFNADGSFTYQPVLNFNGQDSFTYQVNDGVNSSEMAEVFITVSPINDLPVAVNDTLVIDENETVVFSPLVNDSDIDDEILRIVEASADTGIVTFTESSISYTAPVNPGSDTIRYTIADASNAQASADVVVTINDVQQAPIASDDSAETNEDTPVVVLPLANDIDPDGDALELSINTVTNGTAEASGASLTFTPEANFNGTAIVNYLIKDPAGNMANADITIIVAPVNDAPVANNDQASVAETQTLVFDPRINDTDIDGDTLRITAASTDIGQVVFSESELTFTAPATPNVAATINYTISDNGNLQASAQVTVTISNIDDTPLANDDVAVTDEDVAVVLAPLANDSDPDGEALTVTVQSATNGTATLASSTTINFVPNENFNGNATVIYQAQDPAGNAATATITITVNPVNDPPLAVDDLITVTESSTTTLTPLVNDSDIDGDVLSIISASATSGVVAFSSDSLTYASPNVPGQDTISYTINDPSGATSSATISVTVSDIQDVPIAQDDIATTLEDTPVEISPLDNDFDEDGDTLTVSVNSVTSGDAAVNNNVVTYTPATNFSGNATIVYTINDSANNSATANINITITPVNDTPVVNNDSATTNEDTLVQISPLSNDSDPDSDALTVAIVSATFGVASVSDNIVTFTPESNFNGQATVSYSATDPTGLSATGIINITVIPVNDSPQAVNDEITVAESSTISLSPLLNDIDVDGDSLAIGSASSVNGSVTISDNTLIYVAPNTPGQDTINYTINDPSGATSSANIFITVSDVQDVPIANDDVASTLEDTPVNITPLSNDVDEDGDTLMVSINSISSGSAVVNDNIVTYTPEANFNGSAVIVYSITDIANNSATANINITITAVNDLPIANNDSATTQEDVAVQVTPLANDNDPDGDALTATIVNTTFGTATVSNNNVVTFTPENNFNGQATVSYTASDSSGASAAATIEINVEPVNDAPLANNDSATTQEDVAIQITPLTNDTDVDNDVLTLATATASSGTVTIDGNIINYIPLANFHGTDTISYSVTDPSQASSSASITVTISAVNDSPVAINDSVSTPEDTSVTIAPLDNDTDIENDTLSFTINNVTNGTFEILSATQVRYTPTSNFNGAGAMDYTVTDPSGGSATANITINVSAVNDLPIAVSDTASVDEGQSVVISPLSNDTDADGDNLTITGATAAQGTVVVNTDATTLTYTAGTGFSGTTNISYTVTDTTASVTGTVVVTVNNVNFAPVAVNDAVTAEQGQTITISPVSNDTDPDGDTLSLQSVGTATGSVSTSGNNISYTAPSTGTSDSFTYVVTDGALTATGTVSVSLTETTFSGDFDPDGDGDSDVSTTQSGSTYAIAFGADVESVYYQDENDNFVEVSPGDTGSFTLNVSGTTTAVKAGRSFPSKDKNTSPVPTSDFDVTPTGNAIDIFYTIQGVEYSFALRNLDQTNATVNFNSPQQLNTSFDGINAFDFYLRDDSFSGPIRAGSDNGTRYQLLSGGSGFYNGTNAYSTLTWAETAGQLSITFNGAEEAFEILSVYDLDDDDSDGIALNVITRSEADTFQSTYGTDLIDIYITENQHTINLLKDHRIYVDAQIDRLVSFRVDSATYPALTTLHSAQASSVPVTEFVELLDVSTLRINPLVSADLASGIFMDIPLEVSGKFDGFEADFCSFTETSNNSGIGSCDISGISIVSWAIVSGELNVVFSNGVIGKYRWLNDLDFENTFVAEAQLNSSTYSNINYWIPVTPLSDASIVTALSNNFFESGEIASDPDNLDNQGNINSDKTFGYYFNYSGSGTTGLAKNLIAEKDSLNNIFVRDTDRKWSVGSSKVIINSLSSNSSRSRTRTGYIYDLCDETLANASCFIWKTREWRVVGIDVNTLWVIETEKQGINGPTWNSSDDPVTFEDSIERRFTFYDLNPLVPGAPNSISFNQEPVLTKDPTLTTAQDTALNNIDINVDLFDPESDQLTITSIMASHGSVVDNNNNTFNYTPSSGFVGTDTIVLSISDGINSPEVKITVSVGNNNGPNSPTVQNDTIVTVSGLETVITPLVNDTDPNGDTLTISAFSGGTGTLSIDNSNTILTYIPLPTFTGTETLSYTVSDGTGNSTSGTISVTVNSPLLVSSYDLNWSGTNDFTTTTTTTNIYDITFGAEVDAVYTSENGNIQPFSRNASGQFVVSLDSTSGTQPTIFVMIDGVQYVFTTQGFDQTNPTIVFGTRTTLPLTWDSVDNGLIMKYPSNFSALDTSKENGVLYNLISNTPNYVSSNRTYLGPSDLSWFASGDSLNINYSSSAEHMLFFDVYDLDDVVESSNVVPANVVALQAHNQKRAARNALQLSKNNVNHAVSSHNSTDLALNVITKAEADAYVRANGTNLVAVYVTKLADQFTMTQNNGYYYSATWTDSSSYRIDSSIYPEITSANSGVQASIVTSNMEMLDFQQSIYNTWLSSNLTASEIVLPTARSDNGSWQSFAAETCIFTETTTDSGTVNCSESGTLTWSISNGENLNITLSDGTTSVYNWLNENSAENTVLITHTDNSSQVHSSLEFWFAPNAFTTTELTNFLENNYFDSSYTITNNSVLDSSGKVLQTAINGQYFGTSGNSKEVVYSTIGDIEFLDDRQFYWSVPRIQEITIEARSNLASADTFRYLYAQCSNTNDANCYAWYKVQWKPLAIEGNRLYVLETQTADSVGLGSYAGTPVFEELTIPKIHFYELNSTIPGGTNTTSLNQAPDISVSGAITSQDTPVILNLLNQASDPEGDTLSLSQVSSHFGDVVNNGDGTATFTPETGFSGSALVLFSISDTFNEAVSAFGVAVTPNNNAPTDILIDGNITASINENVTAPGTIVGNLTTLDIDTSDVHTYALVAIGASANGLCSSDSGNGTFAINSTDLITPNTVPAGNYDVCVESNDGTTTFQATLGISVIGTINNAAPVANNDIYNVAQNSSTLLFVTTNDFDSDNDPLSITIDSVSAGNATLLTGSSEIIQYIAPSTAGNDTIAYTVSDGNGGTDTATVAISIASSTGNAPVATNDSVSVPINTSVVISPLSNDTDIDGNSTLSIAGFFHTGFGGVPSLDSGSKTISYTAGSVAGVETLTYIVTDDTGNTDVGTISITVSSNNSAPVGNSDTYSILSDNTIISIGTDAGVLVNDTDPDNNILQANIVSSPTHASSFALYDDGSFDYQHDGSTNLSDSFTYRLTDGDQITGPVSVSLSIVKDNFTPQMCSNLPYYGEAGTTLNHPVDFTDIDGDVLTVSLTGAPAWMTLTQNSGYSYTLGGTSSLSDVGTDSTITITVDDGTNSSTRNFAFSLYDVGGATDNVSVDPSNGLEQIQAVSIDRKGNLVVVGGSPATNQSLIVRFTPDGSLDTSFDSDGIFQFDVNNNAGQIESPRHAVIRPDNGIIVVGETFDGTGYNSFVSVHNEDGSLDTNFNSQGYSVFDANISGASDAAQTVELLQNGNIFVASYASNTGTGFYEVVTRVFTPTGALDTSYDGDGVHVLPHSNNILVSASKQSNEGYIYVAGTITNSNTDMYVARYTETGLDTSFASGGIFTVPAIGSDDAEATWDIELDDAGNILLAGGQTNSQSEFVIYKLNVNFNSSTSNYDVSLDSGFGSSGELVLDPTTSFNAHVNDIVSDKRGNYYLVGRTSDSTQTIVAKISSNGTLDTLYGTNGFDIITSDGLANMESNAVLSPDGQLIVVDSKSNFEIEVNYEFITTNPLFPTCDVASDSGNLNFKTDDIITDLDALSSGGFYAAGFGIPTGESNSTALVTKVFEDGTMDNDFGDNGLLRISGDDTDQYFAAVGAVTSDNSYVIAGTRANTINWFMSKVDEQGNLLSSFDSDGIRDVTTPGGNVTIKDMLIDPVSQTVIVGVDISDSMYVYGFTVNGADTPTSFGEGDTNGSTQNGINSTASYTSHSDLVFDLKTLERATASTNLYAIGDYSTNGYDAPALIKMSSAGVIDTSIGINGILHFDMGSDATLMDSFEFGSNIYMLVRMTNDETIRVLKFNTSTDMLDTTFGNSGILALSWKIDSRATSNSTIQVDSVNRIWIQATHSSAGKQMIRLTSTGDVDNAYLNGGGSKIPGGIEHWDKLIGFRITSGDNAILFGYEQFTDNNNLNDDFAFARLLNTGLIDPQLPPWYIDFGEGEFSNSIELDEFSQILLGGKTYNTSDFTDDFAIARFDNLGNADTKWGNASAIASYSTANLNDDVIGMSITDEGAVIVTGTQFDNSTPNSIDISRLKTGKGLSGSLTAAQFAGGALGLATAGTEINNQYLASDGSIYIVGSRPTSGGFVAKLNANGALDTSFSSSNNAGIFDLGIEWSASMAATSTLHAITPSSNGTLIVAGYRSDGSNDIAVVLELTLDGTQVSTFNNSVSYFEFFAGSDSYFYDVTTGPNGNIYAVGSYNGQALVVSLAYTQFGTTGNGQINSTFPHSSPSGMATYDLFSGNEQIVAAERDAYGALVVLLTANNMHRLLRLDTVNLTTLGDTVQDYGASSFSPLDNMQDFAIDSLGNVYVTGYSQLNGKWSFMAARYPNAVGPLNVIAATNNVAPTDILIDGSATDTLADTATGTNSDVGVLTSIDSDTGNTHSYSLVSTGVSANGTCSSDTNNSAFNINGTTLRTSSALNGGTYQVCIQSNDGTTTFQKTLSINVTSQPSAVDDTFDANRGLTNFITPLDNDSDPNSNAFTITFSQATQGTSVISNGGLNIDYTAPTSGVSDTINYTITNSTGGTDSAVINVTINDAPVATADTATVNSGGNVVITPLSNDTDANGDTLTISTATSSQGSVIVAGDKLSLTFTPSISSGAATINYTADDQRGGTSDSVINVTVNAANSAPIANSDVFTIAPLSMLNFDPLVNDTDSNGDTLTITAASAVSGSASVNADNITVDYTSPSANRSDTITYTISDGNGATANGTINVTVNTDPVATASAEIISTSSMTTFTPTVTDGDGDTFTVNAATVSSGSSSGSVTFSGSGITFTSTATEGTSVISYTVQDGFGGTASSTITVTVNTAPAVTSESYNFVSNSTTAVVIDASGGVLANDSDANSETLTVSVSSAPGHSNAFTLNSDGSFSYTHDGMNILTDGFGYSVTDGTHTINGYATINLTKDNFVPKFCTVPPLYVRAGETYNVKLGVTDMDEHSQTFSDSNLPSFMSITGDVLTITPSFNDVSATPYSNITVNTTDGIDSDSLVFDTVVYDAFSQNHFTEFNFGGTHESVEDAIIDQYGNIIIVGASDGDFAVAKLLPTGTLDPAFNSGSPLIIDFAGSGDRATAVKVMKDNKIVIGGITNHSIYGSVATDYDFVVTVLEQNGTFHTSFSGDGSLRHDISDSDDYLTDIQINDKNEIILIGHAHISGDFNMSALKYDATGTIVNAFGASGVSNFTVSGRSLAARSSVMDNEGYIYIVGDELDSGNYDLAITRLNDTGFDTSFDSDGIFTHSDNGDEQGRDLEFDKDGRIIVAGTKDNTVAVWSISLSGTASEVALLTQNFGTSGLYTTDFTGTTTDVAHGIVPDSRGKFFIITKADSATKVIRLNADGSLDTTYNGNTGVKTVALNVSISGTLSVGTLDAYGQLLIIDAEANGSDDQIQVTYDFATTYTEFGTCASAQEFVSGTSGKTTDYANDADLSSDGKVFVVGTATSLVDSVADLVAMKTDSSGNIDSSWGNYGTQRISELTSLISPFIQEAIALNNGELVIAANNSNENGVFLVKLTSSGSLDSSFDSDGIRDVTSSVPIRITGSGHDTTNNAFYVVGETSSGQTKIFKFNSNGTDDNTFGMGSSTTNLNSGVNYTLFVDSNFESHDMTIDGSGNIYVVGSFFDGTKKRVAYIIMNQNGFYDINGNWLITQNDNEERVGISIAASTSELFILARDVNNNAYIYNFTSGALDTTFDGDGILPVTGYKASTESRFKIEVDSTQKPWFTVEDGSNNSYVFRLNSADANFDNSFVNGGRAPLTNGISGWAFNMGFKGFVLDGSNNSLLFGYNNNPTDFDVALAGMNSSGQVLNTVETIHYDFGEGERALEMALDAASSPILVGSTFDRSRNDLDYAITRFDHTGTGQANFATSGTGTLVNNSIGSQDNETLFTAISTNSDDKLWDIKISDSGHFYLVGDTTATNGTSHSNISVLSTLPGSADLDTLLPFTKTNTDINGSTFNDFSNDSYLADDGSLYVVGSFSSKAFIAKFLKGGGLDSTFGSAGVSEFSLGSDAGFLAITSDGQGKFLVAGWASNASADGLIARYNADGSLDTTFSSSDGSDGYDAFDATNCEEEFFTIDTGPDGTIYVGGQESSNALMVAYNSNGTLNTNFNSTGYNSVDYGSTVSRDEGFDAIKVDSFGGIIALAVIESTNQFTISRFKPDGTKLRDYAGLHSPGTITQMYALDIDVLGNVFVTGEIQQEQLWKFYVFRFPNAVGPLH